MTKLLSFALLLLTLNPLVSAQVMESHVDYTVSPGTIQGRKIQYAHEWLGPAEFRNKELFAMDIVGVNKLHPDNIQLVAAKVAFVSKKTFDQLSYAQMNNADYISGMLDSVGIRGIPGDMWLVTNKVKAYGLPFKVSFDFKFREVPASSLGAAANYLRSEATGMRGTRERFLVLDMNKFSMLMYRNYSIVYLKEISPNETMVVAGVIAGIDIDKARNYFLFGGVEKTMLGNLKTQVMNMVRNIQAAK